MTTPNGERRSPEPTPAELTRLRAIRESIAEELPDLVAGDQLRRAAREERSISGAVRDATRRGESDLDATARRYRSPVRGGAVGFAIRASRQADRNGCRSA